MMNRTLYRAVIASTLEPQKQHTKIKGSVRIPSNVPYVVDNLWEWLRPADMPSRRHAVYASPTVELALANASAGDGGFVACVVKVDPNAIRLVQLKVEDARYHADIKLVARIIANHGSALTTASLERRRDMGLLFMPGLSRDDLNALRTSVPEINEICRQFAEVSTFWRDASTEVGDHNGELFFELSDDDGAFYTLEPV